MRRQHALATLVAVLVISVLVFGAPAVGGTATASTQYTVLIEQGASRAAALAAVSAAGGTVIKQNAEVGTLTVQAPAAGFVQQASASPAIYGAAHTRPIGRVPDAAPAAGAARHLRDVVETEHNPNVSLAPQLDASLAPVGLDPLDANQWGLRMVKSDLARAVQPGDHGVMVGVLDSGVDATHPDIAPNINVALSRNFTTDIPTDPNGAPFDGPCEFAGCVDPPAVRRQRARHPRRRHRRGRGQRPRRLRRGARRRPSSASAAARTPASSSCSPSWTR